MRTTLFVIALLATPTLALATPAENGIFVNTQTLNGIFVNTPTANGIFVNGTELSHGLVSAAVFGDELIGGVLPVPATKAGYTFSGVHLEGTGLAGWTYAPETGWVWRTGEWFVGTEMPIGIYDPYTRRTEITRARIVDAFSLPGVSMILHRVEVQVFEKFSDGSLRPQWTRLCADSNNAETFAIALRGEWNLGEVQNYGGDRISSSPYRVTFACTSGALGKCAAECTDKVMCDIVNIRAALGYKPWAPPVYRNGVKWRDYELDHQACTRMVRADYCGDGHPWTVDGMQIDVYDRTGINTQTKAFSAMWQYDGTWNEDGAVRISCRRPDAGPVTCPTYSNPFLGFMTTYFACYADNGLQNPAARLGNLSRHAVVINPF